MLILFNSKAERIRYGVIKIFAATKILIELTGENRVSPINRTIVEKILMAKNIYIFNSTLGITYLRK